MSNESISFQKDIKPLFRDKDVEAMKPRFDLSAYEDVKKHAENIYPRLKNGSMPSDGPWPRDNLDKFKTWMDTGYPE